MKKIFKVLLSLALVAAMVVPTGIFTFAAEDNGFSLFPDWAGYNGAGTGCGFLDGNLYLNKIPNVSSINEIAVEVDGKPAYWCVGYLGERHCGNKTGYAPLGHVQLGIVGADLTQGQEATLTLKWDGSTIDFKFTPEVNALGYSYSKVVADGNAKTMKAEIAFNTDPGFAIGTTLTGKCHDDHDNEGNFTVTAYDAETKVYTIEATDYASGQSLLELTVTSEGNFKDYKISTTVNEKSGVHKANSTVTGEQIQLVRATAVKTGTTENFGTAANLINGTADPKLEGGWPGEGVTVTVEAKEAAKAATLVLYTHDDGSWGDRAPKTFKVYGSNTAGELGTELADVADAQIPNENEIAVAFALNATEAYKYYTIVVSAGKGGYFQIGEVELYTGAVTITGEASLTTLAGPVAYNGTEPKAPAPAPEKPENRYEAEDAILGYKAEIRNAGGDYASSVSGGKFVGGFDNVADAITFKINAEKAGVYRMTVGYISMELRAFDINVNGTLFSNCAFDKVGGSWDGDTKTFMMNINLNAGENTIVFGRLGNAPSLDYIDLELVDCAHANTELINVKEAALGAPGYSGDTFCKDCQNVIEEGHKTYVIPENRYEAENAILSAGQIKQAYGDYEDSVSNGKFIGEYDGQTDAITFKVNVEKAGTYELVIGYISMEIRSLDINVNGNITADYEVPAQGRAWEGDTLTYTLEITLNAGENTISFGQNDGKTTPNLDYIELNLIKEATPDPDPDPDQTVDKPAQTGDTLTVMIVVSTVALAVVAYVVSKKRSYNV